MSLFIKQEEFSRVSSILQRCQHSARHPSLEWLDSLQSQSQRPLIMQESTHRLQLREAESVSLTKRSSTGIHMLGTLDYACLIRHLN